MIEVEIRGPLPKKTYDSLKKLFSTAGENPRFEKRVSVEYSEDLTLRQKNNSPEIVVRKDKEFFAKFKEGEFSNAVKVLAMLGHKKGMVSARDLLHVKYGGAEFTLSDAVEDSFFYEAMISAKDPISAKEAKRKLETLAKNLKLPIWTDNDMFVFISKLNKRVNYVYDYDVHGLEHFKEKFKI